MSDSTSQRFLATLRLELRLICLHWSYWLVYAAWTLFVLSNFQRPVLEPARVLMLSGLGMGTVAVISLVGLAIAGVSSSRSAVTRFALLESAFPTGVEIITGRWLAVFTALAAFALVPILIAIIVGPFESFLSALPLFIGETLLIFAFVSGLVWIIEALLGIRRWMYPLFVMFWIGSALSRNIYIDAGLQLPGANLLAFASGNFGGYSEAFGRLQWVNLPLLYDLFYLALVLVFLSILAWCFQVKRFHHPTSINIGLTVLTAGLTLGVGTFYIVEVAAANQQIRDDNATTSANFREMQAPAELPYQFSNYDITVDMRNPAIPHFVVEFQAINVDDEPLTTLAYSLNQQMTLMTANLPYERSGAVVDVALLQPLQPGETLPIQIVYSGTIWRYEQQFATPPLVVNFTHSDGLNLTAESLWYPVPGIVSPGAVFGDARGGVYQNRALYQLAAPTHVQLKVLNPGAFIYASNLGMVNAVEFRSAGALTFDLLGTLNLAAYTNAGITIVAAETEIDRLSVIVNQWGLPIWETMQAAFPDITRLTIVAIKERAESILFQDTYPRTAENAVGRLDPLVLYRLPESRTNTSVFCTAIVESVMFDVHPHLRDNVRHFLTLYTINDGDIAQMRQEFTEESSRYGAFVSYVEPISDEEQYRVSEMLMDIYELRGFDSIIALLGQMRTSSAILRDLTPTELAAWIEDVTNGG